jgi:hypothetical protein
MGGFIPIYPDKKDARPNGKNAYFGLFQRHQISVVTAADR